MKIDTYKHRIKIIECLNSFKNSRKIVHRDLKLENVMFLNKTDNDCKLIDFGFAE